MRVIVIALVLAIATVPALLAPSPVPAAPHQAPRTTYVRLIDECPGPMLTTLRRYPNWQLRLDTYNRGTDLRRGFVYVDATSAEWFSDLPSVDGRHRLSAAEHGEVLAALTSACTDEPWDRVDIRLAFGNLGPPVTRVAPGKRLERLLFDIEDRYRIR